MSEKIVQLNEEVIKGQIKELRISQYILLYHLSNPVPKRQAPNDISPLISHQFD